MRFLVVLAFAGLLNVLSAAPVDLVRVWPEYRDDASFRRISEYFTGQEHPSRDTVIRSQPEVRAGYYFLLRTRSDVAQPASVELSLIPTGTDQVSTRTFPASLAAGSHVIELGLTGSDWPDPSARPLAWKIRLLAADGTELASQSSYLWSAPTP